MSKNSEKNIGRNSLNARKLKKKKLAEKEAALLRAHRMGLWESEGDDAIGDRA